MPPFSAGIRGVKRACILGLFFCSWFSAQARAEGVEQRGGSFCVVPGLLLPAGSLATAFNPGVEWNLDFDVGVSKAWSVIFGAGYSDLESVSNREGRLVLVPAWFGFKSKAQFVPAVELYWSLAGELVYEKAYVRGNTGTGSLENLDGGAVAGAGFDLWLTQWLLAGVSSRAHFVVEGNQVYPLMELGLRIGIRG
jgi:hypothetical protein